MLSEVWGINFYLQQVGTQEEVDVTSRECEQEAMEGKLSRTLTCWWRVQPEVQLESNEEASFQTDKNGSVTSGK